MSQTLFIPDWHEKVVFSPDGPYPNILSHTDKLKAIIGGLQAGQVIPPHADSLAVYYFLEGTGWMTVDDERYPVLSGTIIITPDGSKRGVEADTRLAFLAVRIA